MFALTYYVTVLKRAYRREVYSQLCCVLTQGRSSEIVRFKDLFDDILNKTKNKLLKKKKKKERMDAGKLRN